MAEEPRSLIPPKILEPIDPTIMVPGEPERTGPDPSDPDVGTSVPPDGTQVIEPTKNPPPKGGEFKPPIQKAPPGGGVA